MGSDLAIKIDEALHNAIGKVLKKHSWLGFGSYEEFILACVREKIEYLVSLPVPTPKVVQSFPVLLVPQIVADSGRGKDTFQS